LAADPVQDALEIALRFLVKRDRTAAETTRRLQGAAVEPAVAERVVGMLLEQRYLDDGGYAHRFAEDRRSLDGWGSRRIEQVLLARGVDRDLVAAAVRRPPGDELGAAMALLRRRVPDGAADPRERDRALGLLLRRGYDFELACDAVRRHTRADRAA
jgi:regulatory protein